MLNMTRNPLYLCVFLLSLDLVETLLDVQYIEGQGELMQSLTQHKTNRISKVWLSYVLLFFEKSLRLSCHWNAETANKCSFLNFKNSMINWFGKHKSRIEFLKGSCFKDLEASFIVGKLCAMLPNNTLKEITELQLFHIENNFPLPTPESNQTLKLFFADNGCKRTQAPPMISSCTFLDPNCYIIMWREKWYFQVHPLLKVNITSQIIDLKYTLYCFVECVLIVGMDLFQITCVGLTSLLFVACGRIPTVYVQPDTTQFLIMTKMSLDTDKTVVLSFSITDGGILSAKYFPHFQEHISKRNMFLSHYLVFWHLDASVRVYVVQTHKHLKLRLSIISNASLWLFDGPGPLCPRLNTGRRDTFLLSSFVSAVYVLNLIHKQQHSVHIKFQSYRVVHVKYMLGKRQHLHINSSLVENICNKHGAVHCIIEIKTPQRRNISARQECPHELAANCLFKAKSLQNLFLNVSVQVMKVTGPNTDSCLYSGLVVRQPEKSSMDYDLMRQASATATEINNTINLWRQVTANTREKDILTLCDVYNSTTESELPKPMITVSSTHQITLTIFYFAAYVFNFFVSVHLSTTQCQGIFLDLTPVFFLFQARHLTIYQDISVVISKGKFFHIKYDQMSAGHCVVMHLAANSTSDYCGTLLQNTFTKHEPQKLEVSVFFSKGFSQHKFSDALRTRKLTQCFGNTFGGQGDVVFYTFPSRETVVTLISKNQSASHISKLETCDSVVDQDGISFDHDVFRKHIKRTGYPVETATYALWQGASALSGESREPGDGTQDPEAGTKT